MMRVSKEGPGGTHGIPHYFLLRGVSGGINPAWTRFRTPHQATSFMRNSYR